MGGSAAPGALSHGWGLWALPRQASMTTACIFNRQQQSRSLGSEHWQPLVSGPRLFPGAPSNSMWSSSCLMLELKKLKPRVQETSPESVELGSIPRSGCTQSSGLSHHRRACACVCTYTHVFTTLVGQCSQEGGSISPESFTENIQMCSVLAFEKQHPLAEKHKA